MSARVGQESAGNVCGPFNWFGDLIQLANRPEKRGRDSRNHIEPDSSRSHLTASPAFQAREFSSGGEEFPPPPEAAPAHFPFE